MANSKKLVLERTASGCLIPTSHKLNQDGYFRKNVWVDGRLKLMMYHQYVWIMDGRAIPDGHEIDHLCKNRACCNLEHLRCIDGTEHAVVSNKERYADRIQKGINMLKTGMSKKDVARELNVSWFTANRWYKLQQQEVL